MEQEKPKNILQDQYGDWSSKRIIGMVGMVWMFVLITLDGLDKYTFNEFLVISGLAICSTLLGIETVTEIWKKK